MAAPIVFADVCCGGAAVALRLLVGWRGVEPPCTHMGGKRRYAGAILSAMGLLGAGRKIAGLVLVDAGPWGWAWQVLSRPGACLAVADVVRGWHAAGESGRDLFDRLAGEPPSRDDVERTAQFLALQDGNFGGKPVRMAQGARNDVDYKYGTRDARAGPRWKTDGYATLSPSAVKKRFRARLRPDLLADRIARLAAVPWPDDVVVLHDDARAVLGVGDVTHAYVDPPYQGTTGYGQRLDRPDAADLARALAERCSVVAVSEAEPLELGGGWHHVELTAEHRGQPRTFARDNREWLTLNRPPAHRPAVQTSLSLDEAV